MKVEIEEHDIKPTISPGVSALYFAEENVDDIQECYKLEEWIHTANSQNSTLTRLELPTEITDNNEQSQLSLENVQVINPNFNQAFNKIKVEKDINLNQPLKQLQVVLFREHLEEKIYLEYKRYVAF